MRHDPASAAIVVMLRSLKMFGMAQAAGELIEQGAPAFGAAVPMLSGLLKAEMAEREVRSIAYQIKAARFPAYKDLAGLSGFPCVAGHNGQQGVPLCHDAKNLPYRMSFSISFWRAALPVPPSSRAVCSIR